MSVIEGKVLPFKGAQGDVPGHAILNRRGVENVVFWTFDRQARMPVETHIHWTRWTQYMKTKWPEAGEIKAVILHDGTRLWAEAISAGHTDGSYERAPILARDTFLVCGLQGAKLLEVAGVNEYLYTRDPAAIINPWESDNAIFAARMGAA